MATNEEKMSDFTHELERLICAAQREDGRKTGGQIKRDLERRYREALGAGCRWEPESALAASVLLRTCEYRGDHSADVSIAIQAKPGETLRGLIDRTIGSRTAGNGEDAAYADWLEIRLVKPAREEKPK